MKIDLCVDKKIRLHISIPAYLYEVVEIRLHIRIPAYSFVDMKMHMCVEKKILLYEYSCILVCTHEDTYV